MFLQNGGQRKAFKPLKMALNLLKGPEPSFPVLKYGDNSLSKSRDMAQNVILQGHNLERQGHL